MGTIGRKPNDAPLTSADINDGIVTPDDLSVGHPTWTTDGKVGIGTSSPANNLHIRKSELVGYAATTTGGMILEDANFAELYLAGAQTSNILFGDAASNGVGQLTYVHADNSMRFRVNTAERMRLDSSGHAIIPAGVTLGTAAGVYNAANTLDDYEEGTWTATLYDATVGGNASPTTATGRYIKVGNLVTCWLLVIQNINTTGMTTGNAIYMSLPFTGSSLLRAINSVNINNINWGAGYTQLSAYLVDNQSRVGFVTTGTGLANKAVIVSDFSSGVSGINGFTLTYRI